jgi:hypothetical protein
MYHTGVKGHSVYSEACHCDWFHIQATLMTVLTFSAPQRYYYIFPTMVYRGK